MNNSLLRYRTTKILFLVLTWLLSARAGVCGKPTRIILDTDMLTDAEDVNALWLLNALADRGEAEIVACVVNGHEAQRASGAAVDVVNTWFGRPDVPLGAFKGKYPVKHSSFTALLRDRFPHDAPDDDKLPSALEIYRSVLAKQPDRSVAIVSVGFLVNLKDLLFSKPDRHSSLAGGDLIRSKVKELVVMGGDYPKGREYNFHYGGVSKCAAEVVEHWPDEVPIVFVGYDLGVKVTTGRTYKQKLQEGPLRQALGAHGRTLSKGRASWDELTVLYAVRGLSYQGVEYWKAHSTGCNCVNAADGSNVWRETPDKNQSYLLTPPQTDTLKQVIEGLILSGPKRKMNRAE